MLAHPGQVDVRITAKAADAGRAEGMIGALEAKVRDRLGDSIFGTGEVRLEEVVAGMLTERGLTIAVVESNTGGAVIQRLCASPERVRFLRRGIVALEVSELARLLGAPDGGGGGGGGRGGVRRGLRPDRPAGGGGGPGARHRGAESAAGDRARGGEVTRRPGEHLYRPGHGERHSPLRGEFRGERAVRPGAGPGLRPRPHPERGALAGTLKRV